MDARVFSCCVRRAVGIGHCSMERVLDRESPNSAVPVVGPDHSNQLSVLLNPLAGVDRSIYIAFPLIQALGTWTVDIVLILRLLAVFPYSSTRTSIFAAIFAFPVTTKISRLVLIVICIVTYADTVEDIAFVTATVSSNNAIVHSPLLRAESACQLADHMWGFTQWKCSETPCAHVANSFVTAVFLWKLRSGFSRSSQSRPIIGGRQHILHYYL
jgi:hypothetical protein